MSSFAWLKTNSTVKKIPECVNCIVYLTIYNVFTPPHHYIIYQNTNAELKYMYDVTKAYFVKGYENIVLNLKILFSWTNRFSHNLQYSCLSIKSKINWQTTISDKYTYINISIFFLLLLECLCLKIPYPNF